MKKVRASICILIASSASLVRAQPVPEGIHTLGESKPSICGFSANAVAALEADISKRPGAEALTGTPEYNAYAVDEKVLTFTTAANKAHPAVACRYAQDEASGGSSVKTEIVCFNSRENCDWLDREFEVLNNRMVHELGAKK